MDHPKTIRLVIIGLICLWALLALAACASPAAQKGSPGPAGPPGSQGPAGPPGPAGPQGLEGKSFVVPGAGLKLNVNGVKFPQDNKPVVSLTITDEQGIPVPAKALEGYGFTLAQVFQDKTTGLTKYQNLLVHDVQGKPYKEGSELKQPALPKATQAFAESGGTWSAAEDGSYTYVFTNTLTLPADPTLTTVLGVYAYKDGRATVANSEFTFVPDGSAPKVSREVVSTTDCNTCHNPLQAHGGIRRETGLCITCHTDQTTDPETGNTLDFKVLIHRLHSGSDLPSVQDGTAYQIVGHNQEVSDFSDVTWPQDTRNCTTCHSKGAQSANYKTAPNAAACTSCHDNINVVTGENHPGGKQTDGKCAGCHQPEGQEFDASITGAHTIPLNSSKVKGVKLEIVKVEGVAPGGKPAVTYKVTDKSGQTIAPADMDYLALTYAGPTSDYTNRVTETIFRKPTDGSTPPPPKVEDLGSGAYRYTFQAALPADAAGSYGFGMEGYIMETLPGVEKPVRVAGFNPVVYVALDGGDPAPRRQVVDREKCNACHKNLGLHGTIRQNTEYCVLCHNPAASDVANRPPDAMPATSINFRVLIHRIHKGEAATNPAVVYGGSGKPTSFGDIVFPGDLTDCETCHLPGTFGLPLAAGIQPTTISQADKVISSILPVASVCTACHDSSAVQGHVTLGTTPAGQETCEVCHGVGKEFDVTTVHH